MISIIKSGRYCFIPLAGLFDPDKVENITNTEQKVKDKFVNKLTEWERVKKIFEVDDLGNISLEARSIFQVAGLSAVIGGIYGGVISSRSAYLEFMRSNEATSFKNHLEAKRMLQDTVTTSFAKGGFKWSWRLTLFSTNFLAVSTIIQAYRGNYGISEYVIAGATTGALYKFNMGPRAWVVGAALGGVLGLVGGSFSYGLLKVTGISMEEARYWQNSWQESRNEYFRKGVADYLEKEDHAVIKLHNDDVGIKGHDINILDTEQKQDNKK